MIPNSLEQYHKKCMKNSEENMDVDTEALKGFISATLLWLPLYNSHLVNCPSGKSSFLKISLKVGFLFTVLRISCLWSKKN